MTRVPQTIKPMHTDWRPFVILKKRGLVAALAGCGRCGRKFFTPSTLPMDAFIAEAYLREKFEFHDCELASAR